MEVASAASTDDVVSGEAVEFRYWTESRSGRKLRTDTTAEKDPTSYACFYLTGDKLQADYGPYPYSPYARKVARTVVLAENVADLRFSRTTLNGIGTGCVRMDLTLKDPVDGEEVSVMVATLMRN
ncbi:MAG: hypothetical protein JRI34_13560 [Deltaproteobacteria bacterium]|nr:hypothetical protein [Deltaproteobacteria bacterium]